MVAVVVMVLVSGAQVGAVVLARHRAQAVADLAALAAAAHLPAGIGAACARAGQLAGRMNAVVVDCGADGLDVVVTAEVSPGLSARWAGSAAAVARAGPRSGPHSGAGSG